MKYVVLLTLAVFLAACGGGAPAPTATIEIEPTDEPSLPTLEPLTGTDDQTITPFATIEGELPMPLPGTLVAPATEDPNAGIPFTTLLLTRTGGPVIEGADTTLNIEIQDTGVMMHNNTEKQISQDGLDRINMLIREMNFFGAQNAFMPELPLTGPGEDFLYMITVERAGQERSITALEGYMPDELQSLIAEVISQATR